MPKCGFNKVALQLNSNQTPEWVFSGKFAAYFQNAIFQEHLLVAASVLSFFIINNNKKKLKNLQF